MTQRVLTTESGAPVADNQNSATAGIGGPLLLQDQHLLEKLARFNRERIPERVVHARGSGAYGYFEVTDDVTGFTYADFLNTVGKRTEVFLRFSTVADNLGGADAVRDPRGFALKFYTEEGNYDLVGNNTPVFFIKDPIKFPDFIHSQKRDPFTGKQEPDNVWDFWAHAPEATHQVTWLMGDRGIPASYRHMNGYGSHTYQWTNAEGEAFFVKYHFKTNQGVRSLSTEQARELAGKDPNSHQTDLLQAIERGVNPSWTLYAQIMPAAEAAGYRFNPFDLTKVWPHADYPLIEVGVLELNRNPDNYHAEVEQAAFSPANVVPGVGYSPDKMLQFRLFSYADAHRHRVGTNAEALPVNRPKSPVHSYHRDGAMRFDGNGGGSVNYEPNSFGGPKEDPAYREPPLKISGDADRYDHRAGNDDYSQAGALFRLMSDDQQRQLFDNIAAAMAGVPEAIQRRQIAHFAKADPAYGAGVAERVGLTAPEPAE